jgi:membrane protease YdiL (CAAX protease family)
MRIPTFVRAIVSGGALAAAGTLPWAALASLNLKHASSVPWAVPPAALWLWLFWRWTNGHGWPRSSGPARRALTRATSLSGDVWGAALLAGLVGLVAMLLVQGVLSRLVALPQQQELDIRKYPLPTVFAWLVMSAAFAGVVEETAFRGWMQGPIERRHGPLLAILVTGSLFGFTHFTHPEVGIVLLPFYLMASAVYGMLAYLTKSILPGLALHAGGNLWSAFGLFAGGRSEWEGLTGPAKLVTETGPDPAFWLSVALALGGALAAVAAYAQLARVARGAALED